MGHIVCLCCRALRSCWLLYGMSYVLGDSELWSIIAGSKAPCCCFPLAQLKVEGQGYVLPCPQLPAPLLDPSTPQYLPARVCMVSVTHCHGKVSA